MWWGLGADKKHHDASPDVQIKSAKCIVLYTSYRSNMLYELQSRQVKLLLNAQGVEFLSVDGADPDYRDVRNQLWGVSRAVRAYTPQQYPQVFVRTDGNQADFFTKVLPARKFFPLRDKIMNVPDHLRWDAASSAPSPRGS